MALLTDVPVIELEELAEQDAGLLDTASTEGLDLSRKTVLAQKEVGIEVEAVLVRSGLGTAGDHLLGGVVVTPALRLWLIFHTLEITYRDAYHSHLNDRYKGKWHEYRDLAERAAHLLFELGVGFVQEPIARAAPPKVEVVSGDLGPATYLVRTSMVNGGGQEGLASSAVSVELTAGQSLRVTPGTVPSGVTGWNVYAGATPEELVLQNAAVLAPGDSWTAPAVLVSSGRAPGDGQAAEIYKPIRKVFPRG